MHRNHPYFYHILLLTLVLACHTLQRFFGFGLHSQIIFFLVIALSIGLFHGMLDIILLQNKPFQQQRFLLIYGALALAACLLLSLFSGAALMILLLLSVWHFGEKQGEQQGKKQPLIKRFILGTNALAAAYLLGNSDVAVILTTILNQSSFLNKFYWFDVTWQVWRILSLLWLVAFALYALLLIYKLRLQTFYADFFEIMPETIVVWLAFLLLPPLLAFSLYFGAYHALRHIQDVSRDVLTSNNVIKTHQKALLLTALASALMLGGVLWLFSSDSAQIMSIFTSQAMLQATIILLVAITLPHAILISLWRKN